MRSVGAREAKNHFSRLLDDVATGETIIITRNGIPVAELRPAGESRQLTVAEAVHRIRTGPKIHLAKGETVASLVTGLIDEGRDP